MSHITRSSSRPGQSLLTMKTLSAAVLSTLLCSTVYAAGLGKLTVLSALGQPLRAEIELNSVSREEANTIAAKLASVDAFQKANIEFNPILYSLRFATETRGDKQFIRVTSTQAINEPFIDMLIEVNASGNRLVREYTFLLDPADLRATQSSQVSSTQQQGSGSVRAIPVPQASVSESSTPATQRSRATREKVEKSRAPTMAATRPAGAATASGDYEVKKGDTLAKIAGQVKPEGVSLDQMLVALYRANPNAFIDRNMNRLRAGQILSVPDAEAARGISGKEAHGVVIAQAADFNNYRNKLAGQVATAAPQKATETKQAAGGKITTKVEEKPTAVTESKDKLKLSKAPSASSAPSAKGTGVATGTEDKIAKDKALAEANARVKELEKNVADLQQVLSLKNKALEQQQKQAEQAKKAAVAAPAASAAKASVPAASAPVASAPAASAPKASASAPAASATAASAPVASAPAASTPAASAPVASAPAAKPPVAAGPAKPVKKPVAPPPPPPPPPSFMEELLGNTTVLIALLAGLLAGAGALVWKLRGKKKKTEEKFDDSLMDESSLRANSLFGSTGGQSVDTNNSVFNSSFTPSSSQLDTNEVDPVAEADVYIAYGRDAQAEEILKEALRNQPERNAVRLKLLEIYANRKDLRAFEVLATELYGLTKGEGEDWAQAVAMGAALDPSNPLYGGATPTGGGMAAPTQPIDDGQELDALLETTQEPMTQDDTLSGSNYFGSTIQATEPAVDMPEEVPTIPEAPVIAEPAPQVESISLDFDLDGLNGMQPAAPVEAVKPAEEAPMDLDIGMLDFSNTQQATSMPEENTVSPATAMSVNIGSDDLSFLPVSESASMDEPPVVESAADSTSMNFDLSDISLDLNPSAEQAPAEPMASMAAADNLIPDLELPPHDLDMPEDDEIELTPDSEMATKLDLAIAYQEIGDKEGARELLDEVIKGGTPDQSEKAKSLLVSMA
ncbi:MAG: FimV family protein [Burkholderiales bacterium]|nr:FimV family protein [Burkholderiales bacterium]